MARRKTETEPQEAVPMKTIRDRRAALLELLELQDATRPMFQRMDALKNAIFDHYPVGSPIVLDRNRGTVAMIEDQFSDRSSVWKSTKFERFVVKRV